CGAKQVSPQRQQQKQVLKGAHNEDELDYEVDVDDENNNVTSTGEESNFNLAERDEDEDGEVNSDDDLEEGEVKEESEADDCNEASAGTGGGLCTWGPSCRFVHQSSAGPKQNRKYNYPQLPPGPRPRPPDDYFYDHLPPPPPLLPRLPPPHLAPIPPPPPPAAPEESAWERGFRHAKQMIVRATRRKEEEVDFDEKRFNLGVDDERSHHSRESLSPSPRARSPSPPFHRERREEYWSSEYERRRRLAYESAPWNEEPPSPSREIPRNRESAEQYRDPWRRSKSPPGRRPGNQRRGVTSPTRRSHSMSSISGSDSASDLSGSSFSGSSFSGSESAFSDGSDFEKSPIHRKEALSAKNQMRASPITGQLNQKQRNQVNAQRNKNASKAVAGKEKVQTPVAPKSLPRASLDEDSSGNKKKVPPPKPRRDSWSDSDSGSDSQSGSSFYSGSDSESDAGSESDVEEKQKTVRRKSPVPNVTKQSVSKAAITGKTKENVSCLQEGSAAKKLKTNPSSNPKMVKSEKQQLNVKTHRQQTSVEQSPPPSTPTTLYSSMKSAPSPNSVTDPSQKKPIKMTFMKKPSDFTSPEAIPEASSKEDPMIASEQSNSSIKDNIPSTSESKFKSSSGSAVVSSTTGSSSTSSRREELLKQLKAVEDAIARKRAKLH
ncbi:hypothetical protein B4U79_02818, partial [Dinothrombium tinctorium]